MSDIIGIFLSALFVITILTMGNFLKKINVFSKGGIKNFVHAIISTWWLFAMNYFTTPFSAVLSALVFMAIMLLSSKIKFINAIEFNGKWDYKTIFYVISVIILSIITYYPKYHPVAGAIGVLIMGYGDPAAALIGKIKGKHKYSFFGNTKSLEGSIAMLAVSFLISFVLLIGFENQNVILHSFIISAVATIVEGVSPGKIDNLTVPLSSAFVFLLMWL